VSFSINENGYCNFVVDMFYRKTILLTKKTYESKLPRVIVVRESGSLSYT
jgi:hypothetical protein